jgi:hypothetical protein
MEKQDPNVIYETIFKTEEKIISGADLARLAEKSPEEWESLKSFLRSMDSATRIEATVIEKSSAHWDVTACSKTS